MNAWIFYGLILAGAAPMFFLDLDSFAAVAAFDSAHEGWYVDQIASLAVVMLFSAMLRRSLMLRREVHRREHAEAESSLLARHDPLTGLPNRRLLNEVMSEALQQIAPGGSRAAMIVDLDGFKAVNDLHGHPIGDALLCEVVKRLAAVTQHGTMLARLGGDEFAVLLPGNLTKDSIGQIAAMIVARLAEPFEIAGQRIEIGGSVGISSAPADGCTVAEILRTADLALYRAKEAGRGTHRFFEPEMDQVMRERTMLKAEFRDAIRAGEIVPFYQPIIALASGVVEGLEVLARWRHPGRGVLTPDLFIDIAEDLRLMPEMTRVLFEQVCKDARQWPEHWRIAINVSPTQLQDARIVGALHQLVQQAGLRASRFEVEITESALIQDPVLAREIIAGLRARGFSVALDDFGTGYSSLYHLREITFDKVKIDRSFVRGVTANPTATRYVEAIIRLVTSLDLTVTAEGIEDHAVLDRLTALGCTLGQGFVFSRPVAAGDVDAAVARLPLHATTRAAA